MKKLIFAAIVSAFIIAMAQADPVTYTVSGWGPTSYPGPVTPPAGAPHSVDGWGYPGDTVTLGSYDGTSAADQFALVDGATYTRKIGTLLWGVDYTYNGTATAWDYPANWPDLTFTINAIRSITIDGATGNISQAGSLTTTWFDDYLSFSAGPMASLYVAELGQLYRVDVTPLGLPVASVNNFNGNIDPPAGGFAQTPRDMMAQFEVTLIPAPAAVLLGILGLGVAGLKLRKFA